MSANAPSEPGVTVERIPVTKMRNGHELSLTVHTVKGAKDGPKLVMFGAIHGDEWMGPEALRHVVQGIDPQELSGTLVVVPVANPLAFGDFNAATRFTPGDGMNLTALFPKSAHSGGDASGGLPTEELSAALCKILEDGATHFIDHHSGGNFATVDYVFMNSGTEEMSKAFGSKYINETEVNPGSIHSFAKNLGIKTMITEVGGGLHNSLYYRQRYIDGCFNVMRTIGMLPGDPTPPPEGQTIVTSLHHVRSHYGGTVEAVVTNDRLLEVLPKGTVLGRIIDPYDFSELEVITAPYDETILILSRVPITQIDPGGFAFMVADLATGRPAN